MYKPIKPSDIPARTTGVLAAMAEKDLKDFAEDSYRSVEIEIPNGRKPTNVCTAYRKVLDKLGYDIKVFVAQGRVFMTKEKTALRKGTPSGGKAN